MRRKGLLSIFLGAFLMFGVACSSDDGNVNGGNGNGNGNGNEDVGTEEPTNLALSDLLGAWKAEGYRYDLNEGVSKCYLMTEDGNDFQYDENDEIISITIKEYCEQYAVDYNADENNTVKGTAEDFADHNFEQSLIFANIEVTEDEFLVYVGQGDPEYGVMTITNVKGTYEYDEEQATFTVQNVAIPSDPVETKIKVFKDEEGRINFRYTDFDIFTAYTYDKSKSYWVYAPMIYYCVSGEPLDQEKTSFGVNNRRQLKF